MNDEQRLNVETSARPQDKALTANAPSLAQNILSIGSNDSTANTVSEPLGLREPPSHPSEFAKGTEAYRNAVGSFFEMAVKPRASPARQRAREGADPYLVWLHSYSLYDSPTVPSTKHTSRHLDYFNKLRQGRNDRTRNLNIFQIYEIDALEYHVPKPRFPSADEIQKELEQLSISKIRETYSELCEAVAEIELSASTLRTNSTALTLAKKLVAEDAFIIFKALEDFHPSPRPKAPKEVEARFSAWKSKRVYRPGTMLRREQEFLDRHLPSRRRLEEAREWKQLRENALERARWGAWLRLRNKKIETEPAKVWEDARTEILEDPRMQSLMDPASSKRSGYPPIRAWEEDWERAWAWEHNKKPPTGKPNARSLGFDPYFEHDDTGEDAILLRLVDEHDWLESDQRQHSDAWSATAGLQLQFWWDDFWEWSQRWIKRFQTIDEFGETCMSLMTELSKIDGTATANDMDIYARSPETQDWCFLDDCLFRLNVGVVYRNELQFRRQCNEIFAFTAKKLRSDKLKHGIDSLIKKQDHFRNSFMDFATVAIFFSSITATTLQFSFSAADESAVSLIVNLCWFASLVLSIASATNSFLGAVVHQSPEYLRPSTHRGFRFLQSWFKFIPPILLSISGLLFLVGICAFTFLSTDSFPNQGTVITHVTVVMTSTNITILVILVLLAFTRLLHRFVPPILSLFRRTFVVPASLALILLIWVVFLVLLLVNIIYCLVRYVEFPLPAERGAWVSTAYNVVLDPCDRWCAKEIRWFVNDVRWILKETRSVIRKHWSNFKKSLRSAPPRDLSLERFPGIYRKDVVTEEDTLTV